MKICNNHWTPDGQRFEVHYPDHQWVVCPVCSSTDAERIDDLEDALSEADLKYIDLQDAFDDYKERYP